MNLSAIFSKTGKGVQEASGKTSNLSRGDRSVLSAIDGKTTLSELQKKFEKLAGPKFEALIQQLDKDGFIRQVSAAEPSAPAARPAAAKAAPPKAASSDDGDGLDFTQAIKLPSKGPAAPKAPPVDLAAAARAEAERKAKEDQSLDYRSRQDLQARAKAEADAKAKAEAELKARAAAEAKARAEAEAKARAAAEAKATAEAKAAADAKARAEADAKAHADAEAKTRAEAEAKVRAAREAAVRMATEAKAKADAAAAETAKLEADLNAKLDAERKAREEAERRASEAAERTRKELEEKGKRDAEEMRQRLEAEMKAKLEEERKAREAEDRKRREEEDRRRKEEDERRAKEDAERKAREAEERKRREDEERKRKEEDERRAREEAERRAKEETERKAREAEERKRREEDERRAREDEERRAQEAALRKELESTAKRDAEALRVRLEAEMTAKLEAERKAREEEDAKRRKETDERRSREYVERRAKEEDERKARDEAEAKARAEAAASSPKIAAAVPPPAPPPAAPAPAASSSLGDDLLADLDSFGKREEEEQKAKEEEERKAKEEAAREAKEAAERKAKEEAEKKRREEEERRRKEEEEKRAKEEAERRAKEEAERAKQEEEERKRKAKEELAAKQAAEQAAKAAKVFAAQAKGTGKGAAKSAGDDDIGVGDEDLDTDDIKRDQKVLAERARKVAIEQPQVAVSVGRPRKWGKPVAVALFVLLVGGVGLLHVMPVSTVEYEKAAAEALGAPVKIGSARLSVITGVEVRFENVSIGDAVKIRSVRGVPEVGSLFGARKSFSRMELEGASFSQSQLADAVLGKVGGENFRVARIAVKQANLEGPLKLPPLDVEATIAGDGSVQSLTLRGGDKMNVQLTPKGSDIAFEISAGSMALPFVPALSLVEFGMKGTANRQGVTSSEFDGRAFDGVISGTARIRWGATWNVDGEVKARGVKVAVFAPALVSEGKVDGRATYSMAGANPATLYEGARMQGDFKIEKGVLGSFDLTRALQTGGAQTGGRTVFTELTGQGVYDKGVVQISNVAVAAGAMNAGASLTIDANGGLSGRIVADVKAATQTLRATLNLSGKVQDPVIRK